MNISEQIRRAVKNTDVSWYAIARAAGVPLTTLGRFMRGERGMTTESVDALGKVLGLTLTTDKAAVRKLAAEAPPRGRPPVKKNRRSK